MELTLDLGRQVLQQQAFGRLLGAELTRLDAGCAELAVVFSRANVFSRAKRGISASRAPGSLAVGSE